MDALPIDVYCNVVDKSLWKPAYVRMTSGPERIRQAIVDLILNIPDGQVTNQVLLVDQQRGDKGFIRSLRLEIKAELRLESRATFRKIAARPDHRSDAGTILWEVLWDNREILGGVAHTHPWSGAAGPSGTDVTTFAAVEKGLGQKLVWPVVTFTEVGYFEWVGPDRLDYAVLEIRRFRIQRSLIEQLRDLSR